jgi:hypothetical protein
MDTSTPSVTGNDHAAVRARALGWTLVAGVSVVLADTAVETFRSQSPARWWIVAAVAAYFVAVGAVFLIGRRRGVLSNPVWTALAGGNLLIGLLAATVWLPEGLDRGMRLAGQPTSVLLAITSAGAVLLAGWLLFNILRGVCASSRMRLAIGLILAVAVAYAVAAFLIAARAGTPYGELFHGKSFWRRSPTWLQGAVIGVLVLLPLAAAAEAIRFGLRTIRRTPGVWQALHRAVALSLVFVMALAGVRLPQTAPLPSARTPVTALSIPSSAELRTAVALNLEPPTMPPSAAAPETVAEQAGAYLQNVPAGRYDLQAAADQLGPGVQPAFQFVRDQVRYESYQGVLRGARGTHLARVGNAVDRSLLLVNLLKRKGSKRASRLAGFPPLRQSASSRESSKSLHRLSGSRRTLRNKPLQCRSRIASSRARGGITA